MEMLKNHISRILNKTYFLRHGARGFLLLGLLIALVGCQSQSEVAVSQNSANPNPSASATSSPVSIAIASPQPSASAASPDASVQSSEQQNSNAVSGKRSIDACQLLTSAEISAVQGEAVRDARSSERTSGAFTISQCFYTLPTFVNSVSLEVTRRTPGSSGGLSVKDFWQQSFRTEKKDKEEEGGKPLTVPGIGDDAFWVGNSQVGALYVLKKDAYLRISIGGSDDASKKIKRSKMLAQKALKRL